MSLPFWALVHIDNEKHLKDFIIMSKSIIYLARYEYFYGQFCSFLNIEVHGLENEKNAIKILKKNNVTNIINDYFEERNIPKISVMDFYLLLQRASHARKDLHHEDFMSLDIQFENIESHDTLDIIKDHLKRIINMEYLLVIFLAVKRLEKVPPVDYKEIVRNWVFGGVESTYVKATIKSDFERIEQDLFEINKCARDFEIAEDENHKSVIVTHEEYKKKYDFK